MPSRFETKSLIPMLPRKASSELDMVPVPQTDTGGRVENPYQGDRENCG